MELDALIGNEKILDCHQCNKPVLNLSRMDPREAATRLLNATEDPCIFAKLDTNGEPKLISLPSGPRRGSAKRTPSLGVAAAGMGALALSGCHSPEVEILEGTTRVTWTEDFQDQVREGVDEAEHHASQVALKAKNTVAEALAKLNEPEPEEGALPASVGTLGITGPKFTRHMGGGISMGGHRGGRGIAAKPPPVPTATVHFDGPKSYSMSINGVNVGGRGSATVPAGWNGVIITDGRGNKVWSDQVQIKADETRTIRYR